MPSATALAKENESLERRLDSKDRKLERIMSRGLFVGGTIGGAALGALLDLRIGAIWGFKPSSFIAAVGIAAVMTDKVPRRHEDLVMSLSLGMAASQVYTRTQAAAAEGFFGGLFGGGGNGG